MDVWWLQAWDNLFFFFIMLLSLPLSLVVPPLLTAQGFVDGAKCLIGINSIFVNSTTNATLYYDINYQSKYLIGNTSKITPDDCNLAYVNMIFYLFVNLGYNIFGLLVVKHGSATLMMIANTVRLPLVNLAFAIHFIMGKQTQSLNIYDIASLLIIIFGLLVFRFVSPIIAYIRGEKPDPNKEEVKDMPAALIGLNSEVIPVTKVIIKREVTKIRHQFYSKLGINIPPGLVESANRVDYGNTPTGDGTTLTL